MKMIEIGRICIKLAGRDAGRECVIVDVLDGNYALIDGNVRRRKCNILHLEPTSKKIDVKKGASHEDVEKEFSKLKIDVWETKPKEKKERPRKQRGKKKIQEAAALDAKGKKKESKKDKGKKVKENKPIDAKIVSVTKEETTAKVDKPVEKKQKS